MKKTPATLKQQFIAHIRNPELREIAEKFLSVLSFPDVDDGLAETFECLVPIMECLTSILPSQKQMWGDWHRALPNLIKIAAELEHKIRASVPVSARTKSMLVSGNRWKGQMKNLPLLALVAESADSDQTPHVLPAKAILFAAKALSIDNEYFSTNCQSVRYAHKGNHELGSLLKRFPAWESSTGNWIGNYEVFRSNAPRILIHNDKFKSYPAITVILNALIKTYDANSVLGCPEYPNGNDDIHFFELPLPNIDRAAEGAFIGQSGAVVYLTVLNDIGLDGEHIASAPRQIRAQQYPDVSAKHAMPSVRAQQSEVKYSNYKTQSQKQILPWAWDVLNPIEIERLQLAITNSAEEHSAGAMLIWLLLFTAMPFREILVLTLRNKLADSPGIDRNGNWCRVIPSPVSAFSPTEMQMRTLEKHTDYVHLELPRPWPKLLQQHLNSIAGPESQIESMPLADHSPVVDAENKLRNFLAAMRLTNHGRFTLGRVQKTLGNYVMRETGDPIIVHLITGLPTDLPPVGTYYAAYDATVIQTVYRNATQRILSL